MSASEFSILALIIITLVTPTAIVITLPAFLISMGITAYKNY